MKKNFAKVFSNAIIVTITIFFVNIFLGVFTVGAGLIITLPTSMVFICIFNLTSYFGSCGERYYLSETVIVNNSTSDKEIK